MKTATILNLLSWLVLGRIAAGLLVFAAQFVR
jgi:hypothetical protein